jgi:hypothetical protein
VKHLVVASLVAVSACGGSSSSSSTTPAGGGGAGTSGETTAADTGGPADTAEAKTNCEKIADHMLDLAEERGFTREQVIAECEQEAFTDEEAACILAAEGLPAIRKCAGDDDPGDDGLAAADEATAARCEALIDHMLGVLLAEMTAQMKPDERATVEQELARQRPEIVAQCLRAGLTDEDFTCGMAATNAQEMEACGVGN